MDDGDTAMPDTQQQAAEPGLLPTLYNGDLDSFQFDQMFTGYSDEAMDKFFTDIFCLPSFPQSESIDPRLLFPDDARPPWSSLQEYRSDADVLRAYYQLIHPVFPILPPPREEDAGAMDSRPDEAYAPSSPLVLSLLSLLAPTHNPLPPEGLSPDKAQRLSLASSFAQGAAEACVIWSHKPATSPSSFTRSALHPDVPADLEVPLAYCVLSLYQYLHCGNIKEMTECTEKALDAAIKLSLHKKSEHASNISMEARSRAWWITYLCVCHAAMAGCKPPTRPIDHSEIQTPFPTSLYVPGTWDRYIRAEETLVAATLLLVALVKGFHSEEAVPSFQQSIKVLDDIIKYQISQLADARTTGLPSDGSPESRLASCLHEVTHIRLMSARIKTHRYRALMEYPDILKKFNAFPPLDVSDRPPSGKHAPRPYTAARTKASQVFSFSSAYSLQVCFESTVGIATCLESLGDGFSVAPFSCSALIAGYTSLMILHFNNRGGSQPLSRFATGDLRQKCRATVAVMVRTLGKYSVGLPFMGMLTDHLRKAAVACDVPIVD